MTLDRYVFRLWMAPFLGFFFGVTGILLFGRVIRAMQAFGDNPIDWIILFEMIAAIVPYFLTLTIPFAFFFALIKTLNLLQQNSESDALLAAGISPLRLLRPMFALAVLFWVFLSWTAMEWIPAGQKTFRSLYEEVKQSQTTANFSPLQFTQDIKGITVYHAGEDEQGYMHQFVLEDMRSGLQSIYIAELAKIQRQGLFLVLTMHDGVHLEGKANALRSTYFSTYSFSIDTTSNTATKDAHYQSDKPTIMSMAELNQALTQSDDLSLQAEWQRRVVFPSTILILLLFAAPLSNSAKRSGKSHGWISSIALLLLIYNVQIALHKNVALGELPWWGMIAGQGSFLFVGLLWLMYVVKYTHADMIKHAMMFIRGRYAGRK